MKIVNLKEFLYLPEGTVFAKFYPVDFDELCIKGRNVGARDFCFQRLLEVEDVAGEDTNLTLIKRMEDGKSFALDLDCRDREVAEEHPQLFAVYESKDLGQLIKALCEAYKRSGFVGKDWGWAEFDNAVAQLKVES